MKHVGHQALFYCTVLFLFLASCIISIYSGRRSLVELEKKVQLREETLSRLRSRITEQLCRLQRDEILLEEKIQALEAGETMEVDLGEYQFLNLEGDRA